MLRPYLPVLILLAISVVNAIFMVVNSLRASQTPIDVSRPNLYGDGKSPRSPR